MRFAIAFVCAFMLFQQAEAGFTNEGIFRTKNINLNVKGTLDNSGELIGYESAKISCDTFSGNGIVRCPQITLTTKIFAYTGEIECCDKCTIITSTPFDESQFKKSGGGEFNIIVDKDLVLPKRLSKDMCGCCGDDDKNLQFLFDME